MVFPLSYVSCPRFRFYMNSVGLCCALLENPRVCVLLATRRLYLTIHWKHHDARRSVPQLIAITVYHSSFSASIHQSSVPHRSPAYLAVKSFLRSHPYSSHPSSHRRPHYRIYRLLIWLRYNVHWSWTVGRIGIVPQLKTYTHA